MARRRRSGRGMVDRVQLVAAMSEQYQSYRRRLGFPDGPLPGIVEDLQAGRRVELHAYELFGDGRLPAGVHPTTRLALEADDTITVCLDHHQPPAGVVSLSQARRVRLDTSGAWEEKLRSAAPHGPRVVRS